MIWYWQTLWAKAQGAAPPYRCTVFRHRNGWGLRAGGVWTSGGQDGVGSAGNLRFDDRFAFNFACSGFLTGPLRDWPNGHAKGCAFFCGRQSLWQLAARHNQSGMAPLAYQRWIWTPSDQLSAFPSARRLNDAWPTGIGADFPVTEVILLPLTVCGVVRLWGRCRPFVGRYRNVSDRFVPLLSIYDGLDLERQAEKASGHLRS
jgi:hypothetical protein